MITSNMDIEIIRRICLARHLFELGNSSLKSSNDLFLFSAANLIQDSIEAFLLAVADFVKAGIDSNTAFDKYFVLINTQIHPKTLPFKTQLIRLNKIRVNSKHYGIMPAREECVRLAMSIREFFEEVSTSILSINFSTVSSIDLLKDGEIKDLLKQASQYFEDKNYIECATNCRKAIYLEILKDYDISKYQEEYKLTDIGILSGLFSSAPYYAKNKQYIDENVLTPIDFIVIDHSDLNQKLINYSVDNTAFWNIMRLTPGVYRTKDKDWIIENNFAKFEDESLQNNIEYIFNTTIDIMFSIHIQKKNIKSSNYQRYSLKLNQEKVPIFAKTDLKSKIVSTTPPGLTKIYCESKIIGIDGGGPYWKISHFEKNLSLYGYIHNDYVQ